MRHRKYLLLDTSVIVDYYLPEKATTKKRAERIACIIDSVRNKISNLQLFVPNICIVETYAIFARWCFGKRLRSRTISKDRYEEVRKKFQEDTHNGRVIEQYELSRYHVIAADLISVVDQYYQYFRRRRGASAKKTLRVADTLLGAMGIWLVKQHNRENVAIVAADDRMGAILKRARRVRESTKKKLSLQKLADSLGLKYSPEIFPQIFHLGISSDKELRNFFGEWPLPTKQTRLRV